MRRTAALALGMLLLAASAGAAPVRAQIIPQVRRPTRLDAGVGADRGLGGCCWSGCAHEGSVAGAPCSTPSPLACGGG